MHAHTLQLIGVALLASTVSAQTDSPEAVIRSFVHAMYSNDLAAYDALTLPTPGRERLQKNGAVNLEAKEELEHNPEAVQIRMMRPVASMRKVLRMTPINLRPYSDFSPQAP